MVVYVSLGVGALLEMPVVAEVARSVHLSTHRTPAHVLLKWGPQQGAAVIPKASSEARIESNHDLF